MDRQLQVDLETLQAVATALERLESEWNEARMSVAARIRGYFTPDEEDRVRQMLLAYRNYRFALYKSSTAATSIRRSKTRNASSWSSCWLLGQL